MDEENKLGSIKSVYFNVPPDLKRRVVLTLHDRKETNHPLLFWKWMTGAGFATAAASMALFLHSHVSSPDYQVSLNTPLSVRVAFQEVKMDQVAQIEVELPEHVFFYSVRHPDLSLERKLSFEYSANTLKVIPFIVRADLSGLKSIKVKFFSAEHALIQEKTVDLQVRKQS